MKRIVLALTLLVFTLGCLEKGSKTTNSPQPPQAIANAPTGHTLALFSGEPITDEDVRKVSGTKLQQAEAALYDVQKDAIDQIVDGRLLEAEAKKKGITKEELLKKNVSDKINITDKDIEKFYNEKKAQMQGKKIDEVKANIRGYIFRDQYQDLYGNLVDGLRKKADVSILIKAPKVEIEEGDNPAIGPKDAPVKIVEFTDYQCPFCGRSRPTVNQILQDYKGKVRYVLRDFPLSFHKDSMKAHEGAHCAGDQNKYWEMNKKLFADQKNIKVEDVKKYAGELRLNMAKFNECLDSGKYTDVVQKNEEYGQSVGVSGTPAFFVNGRMLSGARPFASFKEIIDDELRSAKD